MILKHLAARVQPPGQAIPPPVLDKKHSAIQEEGVFCDHIYFIEKGIVRVYNGNIASHFLKENDFIISYFGPDGIDLRAPGIEALEDITAWDFTPDIIDDASKRFDHFNGHLRTMLQKHIVSNEDINDILREEDSASLLYDYLRRETPDLLQRVPPVHLASFLGVSEKVFLHMRDSNIRTPIGPTAKRR